MSKQPHVWVVESSDDGKTWIPVQSSLFQDRAKEIAVTVAENFYVADYRVAKYVRVEPTAKPRKIHTTMIKLGPGKFVEKDCDAVMTWTQPKKGRKT
ncbi:MAG: hypothetical protein E6R03_10365 [Hyphomicrobiaceae bacterium]|nr:MAG: hypothetical protein E6R03_10365 [Hyphomicrobiaceae bacterium]